MDAWSGHHVESRRSGRRRPAKTVRRIDHARAADCRTHPIHRRRVTVGRCRWRGRITEVPHMSRQNKVNPGTYTQRGRLTQDDAARELRKQSAIGSPHTWQPVNTKTRPRLPPAGDAARDTERSADNETMVETLPEVETRPASRVTRNMTATKAAPSNAKAKNAKAKTARTRKSKRTTGNAKTGKATAIRRTTTKPTRKAVLTRNVGGGGAAPRPTTKRRKSRAIRRSQK